MALTAGKQTFSRFGGMTNWLTRGSPGVKQACISPIQVATLKPTYGHKYPYLEPYPYEKKKYNLIREYFDNTSKRIGENSKVVIVEGNVGVGKNEFAEKLARNFDLKLFPAITDKDAYTWEPTGYDQRKLNEYLPRRLHFYTVDHWLTEPDPTVGTVGRMQIYWYQKRFKLYCRALLHLLSTGQGVVIVNSAFSDKYFVEAMRKNKFVTREFFKWISDYQDNSACELLKPHLTVYLDAPVNTIMDRIKKRNRPNEVGSQVLSEKFLTDVREVQKQKFLPYMRQFGEIMELDYSEVYGEDDAEVLAEQIEHIVFEDPDPDNLRYKEWQRMSEDELCRKRKEYNSDFWMDQFLEQPPPFHCDEVQIPPEDARLYQRMVYENPILCRPPGKAPEYGHSTLF